MDAMGDAVCAMVLLIFGSLITLLTDPGAIKARRALAAQEMVAPDGTRVHFSDFARLGAVAFHLKRAGKL